MSYVVIEKSLSFDTEAKPFATRAAALAYAVKRLVNEGNPEAASREALEAGREVLVADDGDEWTIRLARA